jgi:hypothetical protein
MRTALLSAVAALVLTSTYSISSFAQHDETVIGYQTEMGIACFTWEIATNDWKKGKILDVWIVDATDGAIWDQ